MVHPPPVPLGHAATVPLSTASNALVAAAALHSESLAAAERYAAELGQRVHHLEWCLDGVRHDLRLALAHVDHARTTHGEASEQAARSVGELVDFVRRYLEHGPTGRRPGARPHDADPPREHAGVDDAPR